MFTTKGSEHHYNRQSCSQQRIVNITIPTLCIFPPLPVIGVDTITIGVDTITVGHTIDNV